MPPVPESRNATNGETQFCEDAGAFLPAEDERVSDAVCEESRVFAKLVAEETPFTSVSKKCVKSVFAG